jgi:hypothetical protein
MGKGKIQPNNVVNLPAAKMLTADEALAWLAKHGKVRLKGTELAPKWGWAGSNGARRAQRQIQKWREEGRIIKQGGAISVIAEIVPVPAPGENDDAKTTSDDRLARLALTIVVLVPVAALNAWPRMVQLWTGESDSGGWSFLAFQLLSLFVMTQIPFAISHPGRRLGGRVVLSILAALLVVTNLAFSVESVGHVRDVARDRNRSVEQKVESIKRQLDENRASRTSLPAFVPTSDDEVAAAQRAVDGAVVSREQECGKVGDNCRKRVSEVVDAQAKLSTVQGNKAIADRAFALDLKVGELERQVREAGPAPLASDPGASRLSALTFGMMSSDQVSVWLPTLMSLVAEVIALLGPFVLVGALTMRGHQREAAP